MFQMKKVMVAYTTNSGSTADVARRVAEELGNRRTYCPTTSHPTVILVSRSGFWQTGRPLVQLIPLNGEDLFK
jgi:hypothetical protein